MVNQISRSILLQIFIYICVPHLTFGGEILSGAGATFPNPFYHQLIKEYQKHNDIRIDYRGVGSGSGVKLFLDKKIDFGATDIFLSNQDLKQMDETILHIPTCVGAVAVIYHLPGNPDLKLNSELLGGLLMGNITHWTSPKINAINQAPLEKMKVTVVHRSDSSGTTYILSDFLTKTNIDWSQTVGRGKMVNWPVGLGVRGNSGVAEMVSKIPGSIGYVSLSYAEKEKLKVAALQN